MVTCPTAREMCDWSRPSPQSKERTKARGGFGACWRRPRRDPRLPARDRALDAPDPPKPSAHYPMADRGSPPFEEAQHRRPGDLRVEKRDQRLQVALLPGEIGAPH